MRWISIKVSDQLKTLFENQLFHGFVEGHRCTLTQPAFTSSKLTIETLEQGVKCIQS